MQDSATVLHLRDTSYAFFPTNSAWFTPIVRTSCARSPPHAHLLINFVCFPPVLTVSRQLRLFPANRAFSLRILPSPCCVVLLFNNLDFTPSHRLAVGLEQHQRDQQHVGGHTRQHNRGPNRVHSCPSDRLAGRILLQNAGKPLSDFQTSRPFIILKSEFIILKSESFSE